MAEDDGSGDGRFRYTALREPYLSFVIPLAGLMAVEGGVAAVILAAKVASPGMRWALLGLVSLLHLVLCAKFFAPLLTRHRVVDGRLELRYGLDVSASLDLEEIDSAEGIEEPFEHGPITAVSARFEGPTGRLRIAFSEQGQVLLRLRAARYLRVGLRGRRPVREVLLNVDDRERFLAALGVHGERDGADAASPRRSTAR